MTSLILGVAGAAIGFMVGGPLGAQIGFLAGSLIGNLIDPPKQYGPRLNDLKLQVSTYGKMHPFFWGQGRLAGNMIDQTDLQEHTQKSGGKGGPVQINYTYSASFDISLGAARVFAEEVILGILRIWADGRLIWSSTDGTTIPCTVYLGGEDQVPDPTFEAIHGVGNVPAYRGQAHVVFTDYFLTDFGNRLPQFEFEVYTGAGNYPFQVSVGTPWHDQPPVQFAGFTLTNGTTLTAFYAGPTDDTYNYEQYDVNTLAPVAAPVVSAVGGFNEASSSPMNALQRIAFDPPATLAWVSPDGDGIAHLGTDISATTFTGSQPGVASNGFYYCTDGSIPFYLNKFVLGGGFINRVSVANFNSNGTSIGFDPANGEIYIVLTNVGSAQMWRYDQDLNLLQHWTAADLSGTKLTNGAGGAFVVYHGQVVFNYNSAPTVHWIGLVDINPMNQVATDSSHGPLTQGSSGSLAYLGSGLVVNQNYGVFSLVPPPATVLLSKIVGDLSDMTPISGSYDVSELTDPVRWFVVGNQMVVRNAIQSLRQCFFFDAVETDDVVRFVKRDLGVSPQRTIYHIPDDDLDARAYGEKSSVLLRTIRAREQVSPRTVAITYIDVDTDYQEGTQSSPRQTTLSQQDTTVQVPVGLTADEALAKCWTLQTSEWVEREAFEWTTTRKWAKLIPTDVVYVRGRVIRIQTKSEAPNGVIKWGGVLAAPSLYTTHQSSLYYQPAPGAPSSGFIPPASPGSKAASQLVLLDLPLINDADYPNGFYAAVANSASTPASTTLPSGYVVLDWPLSGNTRTYLTAANGAEGTCNMAFLTPNLNGARAIIAAEPTLPGIGHNHRWTLTQVGGGVVTQFFNQNCGIQVVTGSTPVASHFNLVANAAYTLVSENLNPDLSPSGAPGQDDFQIDFNNGGGTTTPGGSWTGAELFESSDGGTTYNSVGTSAFQDVIGTLSNTLGDFQSGNIFDETNIFTVSVGVNSELSSASELAVLNGANECAIGSAATGWEVLQFKNAVLISAQTYLVSGLLRGRRGTEWMIPLHGAGETFVMLPVSINVNGPFSELGLSRKFKAVTYGTTLAAATVHNFTNTGVALKPYSPAQVGGGWANGDVTVNWVRRTRKQGSWLDFVDVALSEATEQYKVNLYTDGTYTTVATTVYPVTQTRTFTNADLTSAFGSPPPNETTGVYGDVAQLGSYGYGYATRFHV